MALGRIFAGLLLALPATGALAAPLETYGRLPSLENVAISPDGKVIAYVTAIDGKRTVLIHSLDDNKLLGGINVGNQKLRELTWADNDRLVSTISVTGKAIGVSGPRSEYAMAQSFSLSEHKSRPLLNYAENSMNVVYGVEPRTVNGHSVVFMTGITFVENRGTLALFTVDLDAERTHLVETGSDRTLDWIIDENGHPIATTEYDERTQLWSLKLRQDSSWREVYSAPAPIERPYVQGITPDGGSLIMMVPKDGRFTEKQLRLSDGTWVDPLDLGEGYESTIKDPLTHRIIGVERLGVDTTYKFFDPADQKAWDAVAKAFAGENVELVSWSNNRRRVVVRVDGNDDGASYYLVDLDTHKAGLLGPLYKDIGPSDVAEVRRISYGAADGFKIPAYLTLPIGRDPRNLPLVVLPHGGPAARDEPEFDWWSQALAAQGYAVLQPEFRGSDGFGWTHLSAGFGEWGRKMQTDLSDGVRYLAAQGTIDPKRVCIVGASYGGYAALAGATLDTGVYRCAVSVSGVSDPHRFLRWIEDRQGGHSDTSTQRFWNRFMGTENSDDPKLTEISPMAHAANAGVPILLIHGKDDTVVPIEQSEQMEAALRVAGKPVTFVRLEGEDHWLSRSETRLLMLQSTVQFLEANNPPN